MSISQRMFLKPTNMLVFLIRLYIALLYLDTILKHMLQNVILALYWQRREVRQTASNSATSLETRLVSHVELAGSDLLFPHFLKKDLQTGSSSPRAQSFLESTV